MDLTVSADGLLQFNRRSFRCALGHGGIRASKVEGDGATPVGRFALRRVLYRADRLKTVETGLPVATIEPDDGWCDAPDDPLYNRQIRLPYPASHELLWREDGVYDVIVILGHNDSPPKPGAGSAIFMHIARADYAPTEGCVALRLPDLLEILAGCAPGDHIRVNPADSGTVRRK